MPPRALNFRWFSRARCIAGRIGRKPVIAISRGAGLGVKWRNPVTGEGCSDPAHRAIVEEMDKKEAAEENRLLYVAMTRAQNRLILSYAETRRSSPWQKLAESRGPGIGRAARADGNRIGSRRDRGGHPRPAGGLGPVRFRRSGHLGRDVSGLPSPLLSEPVLRLGGGAGSGRHRRDRDWLERSQRPGR